MRVGAFGLGLGLACAALAWGQPVELASLLAEGDAHYARRAEVASGGRADPREVEAALALYRRALAAAPEDGEAVFRVLKALNFRGAFCGAGDESRKAIYDEARRLGQAFVDRQERRLEGLRPEERLAALRSVPRAAEVYYWTGASWGQWALVRGKLAAARQGVAGRVRDLAESVIAIAPELEEAGAYRLLGRLHDQAPRIPFLTGWVSRRKALANLRKAMELAPASVVTRFFLAEAILDHDQANAEEARLLLRSCVDAPPRPELLVEDAFYVAEARARLAGLGLAR
jgi:tetratricopeptide (TPR) repeat protein